MITSKIEDAIVDAIRETVESRVNCFKFNLQQLIGGLLYPVKLECEKLGGVGDIDWLISHVLNTSEYAGPDGEEYPDFNRRDPEYRLRIARVREALSHFGIKSLQ